MWNIFHVGGSQELINVKYLQQASFISGVHPLAQYLSDTEDQVTVTWTITRASSAVTAAYVATRALCLLILSYLARELMPLTDPTIRAEKRRRPHKQIKTVLTDGSCVWEIICLFCIFFRMIASRMYGQVMWEWVYFHMTLRRMLLILTSRCSVTEACENYCR